MSYPNLPRAICRDETEHGKLYYTRAQMMEYGKSCAEDAIKTIDASRKKNNASGQQNQVEDLLRAFGMNP